MVTIVKLCNFHLDDMGCCLSLLVNYSLEDTSWPLLSVCLITSDIEVESTCERTLCDAYWSWHAPDYMLGARRNDERGNMHLFLWAQWQWSRDIWKCKPSNPICFIIKTSQSWALSLLLMGKYIPSASL